MEKCYIVMPAYNEEANIESVVEQWHPVTEKLRDDGVEAYLTIANDGSKDSTIEKLKLLQKKIPYLELLDKPNSGHGATVLYLYRHAINASADFIFQTDSDGQTNPDEFWQMWNERYNYDMQIGHRNHREDGFSRVVVTKVLKAVVKLMFGVTCIDANTPFRLMKKTSIAPIIELIPQDFFLSNVALSALSVKKGLKLRWIPITFRPRQGGVNSINLSRIFKIGIKAIVDFRQINRATTQ